jgi:hypothetical protein
MIMGNKVRLRPLERDDLPYAVKWFADSEVRDGIALFMPLGMAEEEKWYEEMLKRDRTERVLAIDVQTPEDWVHIAQPVSMPSTGACAPQNLASSSATRTIGAGAMALMQ